MCRLSPLASFYFIIIIIIIITTINITTEVRKQLGAALASREFFEEYVDEKVEEWVVQVTSLAEFATTQPQSSY